MGKEDEEKQEVLSDISDVPFDMNTSTPSQETKRDVQGTSKKIVTRKADPKKSSTLSTGSKLLNKARGQASLSQSKRQDVNKSLGKKIPTVPSSRNRRTRRERSERQSFDLR